MCISIIQLSKITHQLWSNQIKVKETGQQEQEGLLVRVCGSVCCSGGGGDGGGQKLKKGFRKYRGHLHKIGG